MAPFGSQTRFGQDAQAHMAHFEDFVTYRRGQHAEQEQRRELATQWKKYLRSRIRASRDEGVPHERDESYCERSVNRFCPNKRGLSR